MRQTPEPNLHELHHAGVTVVPNFCTVEPLIVRTQVPEMRKHVVCSENLMLGDPLRVFRTKGGFEQMFACGILVAPFHELIEI